jgi:hypothetical protein
MREELTEIQRKFNYSTLNQAFVHWALRVVSNSDDDDKISDSCFDGPNDLGIDGIMILEGNPNTVIVLQAKFLQPENSIEREAVRDFVKSSMDVLSRREFAMKGNPGLIRQSRYAREILKSPPTRLILCYFNYGRFAPNAVSELHDSEHQLERRFGALAEVQLLHFDKTGIIEAYKRGLEIHPDPPNTVLSVVNKELLERDIVVEGQTRRSVVFTAKASEIGRLRNDEGRSLLLINVRYGIGATSVNKGIDKTLEDDKEKTKFWFYNNGIYATCKDFKPAKDKSSIAITGIQIVNGCQTATAFGQVLSQGKSLDGVEVLMRIVQSEQSPLLNNISAYTNTQNPVRSRDLRSNDEIQERLFGEFNIGTFFGRKFFYQRKTGEFKHYKKEYESMTRNREVIDNLRVAQAIMGFTLQKPSTAKATGDRLFEEAYGEIFSPDGDTKKIDAYKVFFPWYTWEYVAKSIDEKIGAEKQTAAEKTPSDQRLSAPHDYLKQAQSTIVAIIYYCFTRRFKVEGPDKLFEILRSLDEVSFRTYLQHYMEIAIWVLDTVTKAANGGKLPDENFDARRFFLSRPLYREIVVPNIDDYVKGFSIQKLDALTPPSLRESS